MALKDYYELLEIPASSPEKAVKQAYRRLAMRYHPDRNMGNPYTIQHFRDIQEAYDVLSNPVSRNEYDQKRWQLSGTGRRFTASSRPSPQLIRKEAQKIAAEVQKMDVFRMNYGALENKLDQLLNAHHLGILLESGDEKEIAQIIGQVQLAAKPLPYLHALPILMRLVEVAGTNNQQILGIYRQIRRKRKQDLWDRYKGMLMLIIAGFICLLIFLLA